MGDSPLGKGESLSSILSLPYADLPGEYYNFLLGGWMQPQ